MATVGMEDRIVKSTFWNLAPCHVIRLELCPTTLEFRPMENYFRNCISR